MKTFVCLLVAFALQHNSALANDYSTWTVDDYDLLANGTLMYNGVADATITCGSVVGITLGTVSRDQLAIEQNDEVGVGAPYGDASYPDCRHDAKPTGDCIATAGAAGSDVNFSLDADECSPDVWESGDLVFFRWFVTKYPAMHATAPIQRYNCSYAAFVCSFEKVVNVSSNSSAESGIRELAIAQTQDHGALTYEFYLGDSYDTAYLTNDIVEVNDYIFAHVSIQGIDSTDLIIDAGSCWATPYSDITNDTLEYPILTSLGCAEDNAYDPNDAIVVSSNYAQEVEFKFRAFEWSDATPVDIHPVENDIWVHCEVTICDNGPGGCQNFATACPSGKRKRRSVDDVYSNSENAQSITLGPIRVGKTEPTGNPCKQNNGGCQEICTVLDGRSTAICSCMPGKTLNYDRKTCRVASDEKPQQRTVYVERPQQAARPSAEQIERELARSAQQASISNHIDMALMAIVGLVLVCAVVFVLTRRQNRSAPHSFEKL